MTAPRTASQDLRAALEKVGTLTTSGVRSLIHIEIDATREHIASAPRANEPIVNALVDLVNSLPALLAVVDAAEAFASDEGATHADKLALRTALAALTPRHDEGDDMTTNESDDLRPRGTIEVQCTAPDCRWRFWIEALDPRLPAGPFLCQEHDPEAWPTPKQPEPRS